MRIDSGERVIQEVDVMVLVDGSGKRHARFLSTAEVNSLLANFGQITGRKNVKIGLQTTGFHHRLLL